MKSESIKEITTALTKAQIAFLPIKRTEKVGYDTKSGSKKYNYAPLDVVIEATKKALSMNGLAVTQSTKLVEGNTILETLLSHSSGEWLSGELCVGKQDQPPQTLGSALTYMRRYGYSAMLCVSSEEDDDAESATDKKIPENKRPDPNKITDEQYQKILALATEKGVSLSQVGKSYIKATLGKTQSKELTQVEALQMIEDLLSGKLSKDWKPENKLVEEAKKLGAVEIEEG